MPFLGIISKDVEFQHNLLRIKFFFFFSVSCCLMWYEAPNNIMPNESCKPNLEINDCWSHLSYTIFPFLELFMKAKVLFCRDNLLKSRHFCMFLQFKSGSKNNRSYLHDPETITNLPLKVFLLIQNSSDAFFSILMRSLSL